MNIKKFDSRFKILPISNIIVENESTKTFVFKYSLEAKPGQFIMLWLPGIDEKPMSIAFCDDDEFWITVCNVGLTSGGLHDMKVGDKVGVRGPFGTYYEFNEGEYLALVAGGYGVAPMYFVAYEAVKKGCAVDFFNGARSADLILYAHKILGLGVTMHVATNDGSAGYKGFVTDVLDNILTEKKIDKVFSCGPEVMMKAVGLVADKHNVNSFLSMEKYMKCGIGVCGQCAIDNTGQLACIDGPVMNWKDVRDLPEIGNYHRDAQGKKHYYK